MMDKKSEGVFSSNVAIVAFAFAAILIIFNQVLLFDINGRLSSASGTSSSSIALLSNADLSKVVITQIKSTPQAVAATIDLSDAKDAQGFCGLTLFFLCLLLLLDSLKFVNNYH